MTPLLSVIIPARNEPFLEQTVRDILQKARKPIEIIVILDGYWPKTIIDDPKVHYIHFTTPRGMRGSINAGVALAKGEYLMKSDAHCLYDEGFDEKLLEHIKPNWIVIPRRYALDVSKWEIEKRTDDKYPIDEMILNETLQGIPTTTRKDNTMMPTESFQGSCWFMSKAYFHELKLMDEKTYGSFWQEAQEMALKCEKNGGKVMRNTYTWYAHWHKTDGRGYSLQDDKNITRKAIKALHESN